MPDRGGAADGRRRGRAVRSATAATIALGAALSGACASTVDGAGAPAPGEVAVYRSELSASAAAEVRAEGVELCRESMASMVVMVRGFNAFVARLNAAQTYAGVGDLDEKARASLIAGADGIRPKITERTKAIVVINPNNPTGAVYTREVLEGIADIAREHSLLLLADEIYDRIVFDDEAETLAISFRQSGKYIYHGVPRAIYDALAQCDEQGLLIGFGGHAMAAGLTLPRASLPAFVELYGLDGL